MCRWSRTARSRTSTVEPGARGDAGQRSDGGRAPAWRAGRRWCCAAPSARCAKARPCASRRPRPPAPAPRRRRPAAATTRQGSAAPCGSPASAIEATRSSPPWSCWPSSCWACSRYQRLKVDQFPNVDFPVVVVHDRLPRRLARDRRERSHQEDRGRRQHRSPASTRCTRAPTRARRSSSSSSTSTSTAARPPRTCARRWR